MFSFISIVGAICAGILTITLYYKRRRTIEKSDPTNVDIESGTVADDDNTSLLAAENRQRRSGRIRLTPVQRDDSSQILSRRPAYIDALVGPVSRTSKTGYRYTDTDKLLADSLYSCITKADEANRRLVSAFAAGSSLQDINNLSVILLFQLNKMKEFFKLNETYHVINKLEQDNDQKIIFSTNDNEQIMRCSKQYVEGVMTDMIQTNEHIIVSDHMEAAATFGDVFMYNKVLSSLKDVVKSAEDIRAIWRGITAPNNKYKIYLAK